MSGGQENAPTEAGAPELSLLALHFPRRPPRAIFICGDLLGRRQVFGRECRLASLGVEVEAAVDALDAIGDDPDLDHSAEAEVNNRIYWDSVFEDGSCSGLATAGHVLGN